MERKKGSVNNSFYDTLHEDWLGREDHPIALLIAENKIRSHWIQEQIQAYFFSPCNILDIGCGGGLLTNFLAQNGHRVYGIDLSQSSLEIAKKTDQTSSVRYLYSDAQNLPFDSASFEVVCATDLLEHVDRPELVVAEAARVLKPNGLFFFHTFNRNLFSYLLIIKALEIFVKNTPKDMHLYSHFLKPKELKGFCEKNGMIIETIRGLVPDMTKKAFWKTAIHRKIDKDFSFVFTKSLLTGYVGVARKIK